jgi:hypothetical protein
MPWSASATTAKARSQRGRPHIVTTTTPVQVVLARGSVVVGWRHLWVPRRLTRAALSGSGHVLRDRAAAQRHHPARRPGPITYLALPRHRLACASWRPVDGGGLSLRLEVLVEPEEVRRVASALQLDHAFEFDAAPRRQDRCSRLAATARRGSRLPGAPLLRRVHLAQAARCRSSGGPQLPA